VARVKVLVPVVRVNDSLLLAPSLEKCPLFALYELERSGFRLIEIIAGGDEGFSALREVVESKQPDVVVVLGTARSDKLEGLGVRIYRSRELEVENALKELGGAL